MGHYFEDLLEMSNVVGRGHASLARSSDTGWQYCNCFFRATCTPKAGVQGIVEYCFAAVGSRSLLVQVNDRSLRLVFDLPELKTPHTRLQNSSLTSPDSAIAESKSRAVHLSRSGTIKIFWR